MAQHIITEAQQAQLIKQSALARLTNRTKLGKTLGLSSPTVRRLLDSPAPIIVDQKTYTAVCNFLIAQLPA